VRQKPAWAEVTHAWDNLNLALTEISNSLGKFDALLESLEDADLLNYDELLLRVQWAQQFATEVCIRTGHIVFGHEESICWLTLDHTRDVLTLNAVPLSVADILQVQLFAEKQTSILTSATLSVNETFAFVKSRLGLHEPEEMQLDSPFDYEQQAMVYIPTDIMEPNQRGYQQMIEDALVGLCTATAGRTLALFTSSSTLRQTYAGIQEPLEEEEITVLGQGIDGSRRALLERFREWPRTVLLGTSSFWEGVDVVGDALSALVITKLPFSVPTDPVFAARSEQFSDPFLEYTIPQSILRFKQGFGRLIRSRSDRGIVVVLDKRLLSKKYGQQFLQSLPATSVRTGTLKQLPALAARFLREPRTGN
jgi:DNA polymerase-3 subunit epsilon/ATP-dependent DNA helicase DinG